MTVTISRLYDNYADAQRAVTSLEAAGVPHSDLSIVANNSDNWYNTDKKVDRDRAGVDDRAEGAGAGIGAGIGSTTGLLAGLGLLAIPGLKLYGITDPQHFENRCATIVVRIDGHTPLELATKLGERGFFTWDGNYYALNLTEQLDVERLGGFLRIGLVHYNTMEEVEGLLAALLEIVGAQ